MPDLHIETLLDRLTESVSVYDTDARLRYINAAGARAFGRPVAEILGHRPWDLVPADPTTPFREALREVARGGEGQTIATFVRAFDRWYECDLYPLPDGALVVARDITERRLAQEKLEESEARFRAMIEYAPEAIVIVDTEAQSFTAANTAAERLFGLSREELLKGNVIELIAGRRAEGAPAAAQLQSHFDAAIAGAMPEFEWLIRNTLGQDIACEVRLLRLPQHDRLLVRGSITDISTRRRMQEQLTQAQRLEAMGRLAGGVAHDFNNMMTVVLGTAEALLSEMTPTDPIRADLADIVGAAERATLVTRQLLAFGRRQRLAPLLLDLSGHIEQMHRVLVRVVGEDIELELELARPLGTVRVDAGQIEQVIMNLVVNARDAMPNGGRLTIHTANVTFDDEYSRQHAAVQMAATRRYVMLAVTDTGEGMSADVRAHIFEPFFTTKELGRGTGLGLSTVHGIVEQSGGHIQVDSEPGRGTTFKVYLPRVDEPQATVSEPPQPSVGGLGGRETILLVEDDASVRQYVRKALQRGGYTVLDAHNGGEALLLMEQHQGTIDLLLTDVVMPRMTGLQLAVRLRVLRADLPALYMSGYTEDRAAGRGGLGPNDMFVQKPVGPDDLLRTVRAALDRAPRR